MATPTADAEAVRLRRVSTRLRPLGNRSRQKCLVNLHAKTVRMILLLSSGRGRVAKVTPIFSRARVACRLCERQSLLAADLAVSWAR
jgi:hypothetical protein